MSLVKIKIKNKDMNKSKNFINLALILIIIFLLVLVIYQQLLLNKLYQKIRVGFVYINNINDFGWTYAHEAGRVILKNTIDKVHTIYRENISPDNFNETVRELIEKEKCKVIVGTSFSYDTLILNLADIYPDVIFLSCAGYTIKKNVIPYMVDSYQIYYLNGLIAAGLSKTGKIGYIGAFKIPEIIRHLNSFAIGINEIEPSYKVYFYALNKWYDPEKSSYITQKMIDDGIDVIAYTEDSPSIAKTCQAYYEKTGKKVYTFSHYSPMDKFGKDVIVSGQLVTWGLLYCNLISKILTGKVEPKLHYWFVNSGAAILGKNYNEMISNEAIEILKSKNILFKQKPINLYEYILIRYDQMKQSIGVFDPFTGPIYSKEGKLLIYPKEKLSLDEFLNMDWFFKTISELNY